MADDVGRLLHILQGLPRMSEVWERAKSSCVSHESHNQVVAFRGWGIDLIGQIYPPSSKNHNFILVATDYFTKWVEAIPLKNVTSKEMIEFVREHTIYRFGIPQTITTDQVLCLRQMNLRNLLMEWGLNC